MLHVSYWKRVSLAFVDIRYVVLNNKVISKAIFVSRMSHDNE